MSQPNFESADPAPSILTRKPAWNVYNAMLCIALCSLVAGIGFLVLELARYGFRLTGP